MRIPTMSPGCNDIMSPRDSEMMPPGLRRSLAVFLWLKSVVWSRVQGWSFVDAAHAFTGQFNAVGIMNVPGAGRVLGTVT